MLLVDAGGEEGGGRREVNLKGGTKSALLTHVAEEREVRFGTTCSSHRRQSERSFSFAPKASEERELTAEKVHRIAVGRSEFDVLAAVEESFAK